MTSIENQLVLIEAQRAYIKQCDEKLSGLRESLQDIAYAELSAITNRDEAFEAGWQAYWTQKDIRVGTIDQALSQHTDLLNSIKRSASVSLPCYDCGQITEHSLNSRTEYLEIKRSADSTTICVTCKEARRQSSENRQQQLREKEQEREHLRTMPYAEYLQTDHWVEVRKQALKRSGFRCQTCNTNKKTLHVHHRTYENRGNEHYKDLTVLCEDCHEVFHQNRQVQS